MFDVLTGKHQAGTKLDIVIQVIVILDKYDGI